MAPTMSMHWRSVLLVIAAVGFVVANTALNGWVIGSLALVAIVCCLWVLRRVRGGHSAPGEAPSDLGHRVLVAMMSLALFAGIYFAARASGNSNASALVQAAAISIISVVGVVLFGRYRGR
jgi:drug/metabolite transporter (DMT)-like permease